MPKLDHRYLTRQLMQARRNDSDAFAELFAATYEKQYQYAYQCVKNPFLAQDILQEAYISILRNIRALKNSRQFIAELDRTNEHICSDVCRKDIPGALEAEGSSAGSAPQPQIDVSAAGQILDNVLAACNRTPNVIPIERLREWGNYQRPAFGFGKVLAGIYLAALLCLPCLYIKPSISAERILVATSADAIYQIHVRSLFPLVAASATLDGTPLSLEASPDGEYIVTATANGELALTATSCNGQTATRTYTVSHLDSEKPLLLDYHSEDNRIYLDVQDTYSGIDYEGISGLTPESYDAEAGTIVFKIPESTVSITIPDHAGNELHLSISPVQDENSEG